MKTHSTAPERVQKLLKLNVGPLPAKRLVPRRNQFSFNQLGGSGTTLNHVFQAIVTIRTDQRLSRFDPFR